MCGIVAYIGTQQAYPIIVEGLKRLEYRGYDSAGISVLNGVIKTVKKRGKSQNLKLLPKIKTSQALLESGIQGGQPMENLMILMPILICPEMKDLL